MQRAFVLSAALALTALTVAAQKQVPPADYVQPTPNDVVLGGNNLLQTVTCRNNAAYIQGQSNTITVHGNCRFIRVQGNMNTIHVARFTTVYVEGNGNEVSVTDPATQVSARGEDNHFTASR